MAYIHMICSCVRLAAQRQRGFKSALNASGTLNTDGDTLVTNVAAADSSKSSPVMLQGFVEGPIVSAREIWIQRKVCLPIEVVVP